jgi:hypothetical protein
VLGSGVGDVLSEGLGVGELDAQGSGDAVGNSGGTDDWTIGPLTSADADADGVGSPHGARADGVGDAADTAGPAPGTSTAAPGCR